MIFFDPPVEGGGGQSGQGGTPPVQQQQQQQAPADPWAGVDMDMLPDHVREAATKSKEYLQSLQTQVAQGQTATQTAQQLQAEVDKMRQEILRGKQSTSSPQTRTEAPTFDEQLEQYYLDQGLPEVQAKAIAKMNRGAFEIFGKNFQQQIGQQMAPIANRVVEDSASEAFHGAVQNDRVGWSQIPEIQQALWERTTQMAQQGQIVSPQVVANLAKIFYYDHLERGGIPTQPQNIVPINQPHTIPNMTSGFNQQQSTRFSYPGAGNMPVNRQSSNGNQSSILDAETQAALAATTGNWAPPLQAALKQKQAAGR